MQTSCIESTTTENDGMSTHKRTAITKYSVCIHMQVTYAYTYTTQSETKKWPPCKGSNISRVVYIYPICPLAQARRILFYRY